MVLFWHAVRRHSLRRHSLRRHSARMPMRLRSEFRREVAAIIFPDFCAVTLLKHGRAAPCQSRFRFLHYGPCIVTLCLLRRAAAPPNISSSFCSSLAQTLCVSWEQPQQIQILFLFPIHSLELSLRISLEELQPPHICLLHLPCPNSRCYSLSVWKSFLPKVC